MFRPTRPTLDALEDRSLPGYVLGASPEPPAALVRESAEAASPRSTWTPPVESQEAAGLLESVSRADGVEFSLSPGMVAFSSGTRAARPLPRSPLAAGLTPSQDLPPSVVTEPRGEDRGMIPPGSGLADHRPSVWPRLESPALSQGILELLTTPLGGDPPAIQGSFSLAPDFADFYQASDLGEVPDLPINYGGFTFLAGDPDTLLIAGASDSSSANLYIVGLARDEGGHITGFNTPAYELIDTPYLGGNVVYGPDGILFYPRWPVNEIGQVLPGSAATDKVIDASALGMASSVDGMGFVPAGLPGEGQLKVLSWTGGQFYSAEYAPDGAGTYDITSATQVATVPGGATGFTYLQPGYPLLDSPVMVMAEWSAGNVVIYSLDDNGNPVVETRKPLLTGDAWFHAVAVDPATGDILVGTWGGNNHLMLVQPLFRGPGPILSATYLFQEHLNPEQELAPALIPHDPLGFNRFEVADVFGQERVVYRMDGTTTDRDNAGLMLDTTGLLTPNRYSLEMVFEFVEGTGSWRKMIDVLDRVSDNGMYLNPSNQLELWPAQAGTRPVPVNQFRHLVVTNASGSVQVYLDGTREFTITSTTLMNIDNPANVLRLFVDDEATSAGEYADSRAALLRVYDGILSPDDVALLAKDPFAY